MNLVDLVYKNARLYPKATAYVEVRPVSKVKKQLSWRQFDEQTSRLANALLVRGIKKDDRVLLFGRNSIDWLVAYFATMKVGGWIVPLNFRFMSKDIESCAKVAEPIAFFFDGEFVQVVNETRTRLPSIRHYICMGKECGEGVENMEVLIDWANPEFPEIAPLDEDTLGLYFTSGTTGIPKPIVLLHKNLFGTAVNEVANLFLSQEDTLLQMPPMYHTAIGHLLGSTLTAAKTVLLTEKVTPEYIFEAVHNEEVRVVFLLVPWAIDILEALDKEELRTENYRIDQWRIVQMGAQPIPPSLVKRWKQYFPHMKFHNTYGLSESSGPGTIHLGDERKIGTIGKPGLLWDARVVDENEKDVPPGEVGEIVVKGMGVMKEYYKNAEMTMETLKNGWLHTGDLGKIDEEGFFSLVDRKKDLVISGGENIFPVEVEEVIGRHPKVRDVAVIGVEDKRLGEIVAAVIEPVAGQSLTEEEIRLLCEQNLPRYKRPRKVIFDHVPRNSTGKLDKSKLREKYGKKN